MSGKITLDLRPFGQPNFVRVGPLPGSKQPEEGRDEPCIAVTDLPRETLLAMCEEFTAAMLARWDKAHGSAGSSQEGGA